MHFACQAVRDPNVKKAAGNDPAAQCIVNKIYPIT
jgi:hypothetical protein